MSSYEGILDIVSPSEIKGWVINSEDASPIDVELYINSKKIDNQKADILRAGLKKNKIHPTGQAGFNFKNVSLETNDKVTIRINGRSLALTNSPWTYIRSDKRVLIVGLAKSGTSILAYRIANGLPGAKLNFEPGGATGLIDYNMHQELCMHEKVVTKSLFSYNSQVKWNVLSKIYDKKIFIVRDPRDNIISNFFYIWNHGHNPDPEKFENAYAQILAKEEDSSIPFTKSLRTAMRPKRFIKKTYGPVLEFKKQHSEGWHILKYEDLIDGNVDALNEYLGFDIKQDAEVNRSFKRVVRSKAYGSWRNYFSQQDVRNFKEFMRPYLRALGYKPGDWKLNDPQVLDPKQGSEYMKKLFEGKLK